MARRAGCRGVLIVTVTLALLLVFAVQAAPEQAPAEATPPAAQADTMPVEAGPDAPALPCEGKADDGTCSGDAKPLASGESDVTTPGQNKQPAVATPSQQEEEGMRQRAQAIQRLEELLKKHANAAAPGSDDSVQGGVVAGGGGNVPRHQITPAAMSKIQAQMAALHQRNERAQDASALGFLRQLTERLSQPRQPVVLAFDERSGIPLPQSEQHLAALKHAHGDEADSAGTDQRQGRLMPTDEDVEASREADAQRAEVRLASAPAADVFAAVADATGAVSSAWGIGRIESPAVIALGHTLWPGQTDAAVVAQFRAWDADAGHLLALLNATAPNEWGNTGDGPEVRDVYPENLDDALSPFGYSAHSAAEWLAPPHGAAGPATADDVANLAWERNRRVGKAIAAERVPATLLAALDCTGLGSNRRPCELPGSLGTAMPAFTGSQPPPGGHTPMPSVASAAASGRTVRPAPTGPLDTARFAVGQRHDAYVPRTHLQLLSWLSQHEEVVVLRTPNAALMDARLVSALVGAPPVTEGHELRKMSRQLDGLPVLLWDDAALRRADASATKDTGVKHTPPASWQWGSSPSASEPATAAEGHPPNPPLFRTSEFPFPHSDATGTVDAGELPCPPNAVALALLRKVDHAGTAEEGRNVIDTAAVPTGAGDVLMPLHEVVSANVCFGAEEDAGRSPRAAFPPDAQEHGRALRNAIVAWASRASNPYVERLDTPGPLVSPIAAGRRDESMEEAGWRVGHGPGTAGGPARTGRDGVEIQLVLLSESAAAADDEPLAWMIADPPCRAMLRHAARLLRKKSEAVDSQRRERRGGADARPFGGSEVSIAAWYLDGHQHPQAYAEMSRWPRVDTDTFGAGADDSTIVDADDASTCRFAARITMGRRESTTEPAGATVRRVSIVANHYRGVAAGIRAALGSHRGTRRWKALAQRINPRREVRMLTAKLDQLRGGAGPAEAAWSSVTTGVRRAASPMLFAVLGSAEFCAHCTVVKQHAVHRVQGLGLRSARSKAKVRVMTLSWGRQRSRFATRAAELPSRTWRDDLLAHLPLASVPAWVAVNDTHVAVWQPTSIELVTEPEDVAAFAFAFGFAPGHTGGTGTAEANIAIDALLLEQDEDDYVPRASRWRKALRKRKRRAP